MKFHPSGGIRPPGLRCWRLLWFWPVFFLIFTYAERYFPAAYYYPMHCWLDDLIPFNEWFVIPYVLWFPFVGGMLAYTFLRDGAAFRRLMAFIMLTYSAALLAFFLFPTCQHLRPVFFTHRNLLTELTASIYANDTNTNVCPSIHVIGSLAVWLAARDMKQLPAVVRKGIIPVTAILICASTVFLKQHSALDVLAAIMVCGAGYPLVYRRRAVETAVLRREAAAGRRKYPQV